MYKILIEIETFPPTSHGMFPKGHGEKNVIIKSNKDFIQIELCTSINGNLGRLV